MHRLRALILLFVALGIPPGARAASGTSIRLRLPVEVARPGDTFLAGLELSMKGGWHTYWRNGGDSGAPATVEWTLPPGVTAGEFRWPAPERLEDQDLVTYVYHGTVTLLVPISIGSTAAPGKFEIVGAMKWLECEKECIMSRGPVRATLGIGPVAKPSGDVEGLGLAAAKLPPAVPEGAASAAWDGPVDGDKRSLLIHWRAPAGPGTPDFFPDAGTNFTVEAKSQRLPRAGDAVVLRKVVKLFEGAWPTEVRGLFVQLDAKHLPIAAFEAVLPLAASSTPPPPSPAPAVPGIAAMTNSVTAAPLSRSIPSLSLGRALLLGLLGGVILNIMPCVLPVIALKILGFVRQGGQRPAEIRKLGVIYGIGVWFSFLVLAGVVIGVKKAAGIASWGMQFGNPIFLVALTSLILLVALSLFGVFEINPNSRALDAAGDLASKEGPAGAFFNGMLAVALATPCTAPFLAPALGYAFTADSMSIVLIFSAVAFGLAAPYVILSCQPRWLKFLPKPGAWMVHFKVAMGFPMLATALWLYTLAAAHFGDAGPLWLGVYLVGLALAAWIWGEFAQRGRRHPVTATLVALVVLASSYAFALERELDWRQPPPPPGPALNGTPAAGAIDWQPWSRDAVALAREAHRPVFVDFTAEWCLTCKVNERSSINIPSVREKLRAGGFVSLRGDHTRLPPAITQELQRFGRAGVPLVLVYPRDPTREPRMLPEVLTPGIVLGALDEALK